MLRVDCYDFFTLGTLINPLTEVSNDSLLINLWADLWRAKTELNSFYSKFPLKTSRNPAIRLFTAISAVIPDDFTQIKFGDEESGWTTLDYSNAHEIRESAKEFVTVLKAELSGWDIFFVSQKGAFNTSDLITSGDLMLPEAIRNVMPAEAIFDMREAGRCLAFNLGTATGFHILRAAEAEIRKYYEATVGRLPDVKSRNWGAYIRNMRACGSAEEKILILMGHIKDAYRNPVLHPEDRVTPEEALVLISLCNSLITMIEMEITKIPQPQMALALESQL